MRHYATLAQFGGGALGTEPITLVLGSLGARPARCSAIRAAFFISQKFSLGGVQYGEQLRGYEEFSITPQGYVPETSQYDGAAHSRSAARSTRNSVELGLRINQQIYLDAFYDAGNIWARPQDFNPTRLFRGVGFGGSLVTPLGPLGIDWGYGFDRRRERRAATEVANALQARTDLLTWSFHACPLSRGAGRARPVTAMALPARAQGAEGRLRPDQPSCSTRRPAAPRPRRSSRRRPARYRDQIKRMSDSLNAMVSGIPEAPGVARPRPRVTRRPRRSRPSSRSISAARRSSSRRRRGGRTSSCSRSSTR